MEPQDELVLRIQEYVATQVPPPQVPVVTRAVVLVVAALMQDPRFLNELEVIKELNARLNWLHNENLMLKQVLQTAGMTPRKAAPKKAAPKKAAPRRRAPQVRGGTKAQRDAFRRGYQS